MHIWQAILQFFTSPAYNSAGCTRGILRTLAQQGYGWHVNNLHSLWFYLTMNGGMSSATAPENRHSSAPFLWGRVGGLSTYTQQDSVSTSYHEFINIPPCFMGSLVDRMALCSVSRLPFVLVHGSSLLPVRSTGEIPEASTIYSTPRLTITNLSLLICPIETSRQETSCSGLGSQNAFR